MFFEVASKNMGSGCGMLVMWLLRRSSNPVIYKINYGHLFIVNCIAKNQNKRIEAWNDPFWKIIQTPPIVFRHFLQICSIHIFLKIGHSRPLFLYFRLFNKVDSKEYKIFQMTGFELRTSSLGSNHSTNSATNTAPKISQFTTATKNVLQFGHPNRFHRMKSRRLWRRHKNTLNSFFPSTPNREMKAHQKIVKLFSYRNDDGEANDGWRSTFLILSIFSW